ncbi:MAG: anti-sigma regulatory factor [Chloroflexi bacterium]|nr:anti-sigma regulatory factor [Chloroflexota bacterium]
MDVAKARREGMQMSMGLGFNQADATKIAVVISELGRNIVNYAGSGTITVIARSETNGKKYMRIIADDKGPGIPDVERVLAGGYTTSNGLGLGISGSKKLVDEFSIHSEVGKGTTVTAVKWLVK